MVREKTADELLFDDEEEEQQEKPAQRYVDEDDDLDKNLNEESKDDEDLDEDFAKEDDVVFDGDEERPIKKENRGRPRKIVPNKPVTQKVVSPKAKFVAFKQTANEGILDAETQEVIATTEWEWRAEMLNRLEELRDLIGR